MSHRFKTTVFLALLWNLSGIANTQTPEVNTADGIVAEDSASFQGPSSLDPSSLDKAADKPTNFVPKDQNKMLGDSVEVWSCNFEEKWDINYDTWPDRWTRTNDESRPSYVRVKIEEADSHIKGRKLTIYPDAASARVSSPPIHVMPKFSYIMGLRLRTLGVTHGKTTIRLVFLDSEGNPRQIEEAKPISSTPINSEMDSDSNPRDGWTEVKIGAIQPNSPEIDRVIIQVDFDRVHRGDLGAEISVADMHLWRQPSIEVFTGSRYNVYTKPEDVVVTCRLSGILDQNPEIRFQLLDATNKKIGDQGVKQLHGEIISETRKNASDIVDGFGNEKVGYEGSKDWHPPITDYGFYRVRVQMISSETGEVMSDPAITIAVVKQDDRGQAKGEFGWSLRKPDQPLPFNVLKELLPLTGLSYVKLPIWYAMEDSDRGEEILEFASQLSARDIELVGILSDPTELETRLLNDGPPPPIEALLSTDPSYWIPMFDHVITKLSLQVRWWQLGFDHDASFVGSSNLIERINSIRSQMFRFGQDIRFGLGWRWEYLKVWDKHTPWDFEQLSAKEQLNADELDGWMQQLPPTSAQQWVLVEPNDNVNPAASEVERHQLRVRDFVEQIIVAKVNGAEGIFISNPFSGEADPEANKCGVMNHDGTPGELLLPWRTCAQLLSGATYMGQQVLPEGSSNWIFKRPNGQVVMVLWNQYATTETLYLGEDIQVIDIWGKTQSPTMVGSKQVIAVDRMPRFVVGVSEEIAKWRMSTRFAYDKMPSVFGVPHSNKILYRNTFKQGVGGQASLFVPEAGNYDYLGREKSNDSWTIQPDTLPVNLAVGSEGNSPFTTTLIEANYGEQIVRIDFKIEGDQEYEFSVWRKIHVGMGDVRLMIKTEITDTGRLLIKQEMQNDSDMLTNFKCQLYAPPSRRKRVQVYQLGTNVDKKIYSYLDGRNMVGREMKLRVEEVDGSRVLIHRFVVPAGKAQSLDTSSTNEAEDKAGQKSDDADAARQGDRV